jgi:hypothetical protein
MSATRPDDADPYFDPNVVSSDDAGLGMHIGPGDLAPDEERLLAALERDAAVLQADPVADFVAQVRADRQDGGRPDSSHDTDDGLTPLFTAPDVD